MLSFPPSFRNLTPIDYMKSHQDLFLHGPYRFQQQHTSVVPSMHIKTWSLESMSEPLILSNAPSDPNQLLNSRSRTTEPIASSPSTSTFMTQKRNQPIQLRSVPYTGLPNQISSFDLEYALLEHALRKDKSSSSVSKVMEEGRSQKCSSPPLLEPEFYFGDILGDEAVPPQPLVNICKEEEKIQPEEDHHVEDPTNFANFEHRLPLSDNNHLTSADSGMSNATEPHETDLSTALASLVNSHVSSESINPRDFAQSGAKTLEISAPQKKFHGLSKRQAPDSALERPTKFARYVRNSVWPTDGKRTHEQFLCLDSNRKSVTEPVSTDLLRGNGAALLQQDNTHGNTGILGELAPMMRSPVSDSSMSGPGIRSHPDLYENLSKEIREKVDNLRQKISAMPRRKLRESLAQGVTLEDVEPLMCLNRDELAAMLGLGVTTLKMFVHNTLGVPRWPARALKSQQVKVQKLVQKKMEAERKGDQEQVKRVQRDLTKMTQVHMRRKKLLRKDGKMGVEGGMRKKDRL